MTRQAFLYPLKNTKSRSGITIIILFGLQSNEYIIDILCT